MFSGFKSRCKARTDARKKAKPARACLGMFWAMAGLTLAVLGKKTCKSVSATSQTKAAGRL